MTDVVLMPSPYAHGGGQPARKIVYFENSYRITDEVWLANFDTDFAKDIMDACQQRGKNFDPIRQYGAPYGFVRTEAPSAGNQLHFDSDARLFSCVALSRLVHPTSLGFQISARVLEWENGHRKIVPHAPDRFNAYAFVTDTDSNWLVPSDVPDISRVASAYFRLKPPQRVLSAMLDFEMAARNYYVDVRWPLLVTGLEALIHVSDEHDPRNPTRYAGSTRVFVDRLLAVGKADPALEVDEAELRTIYDSRSTLVHGQAFGQLDQRNKELYRTTENLLRRILKKSVLEPTFAATFNSDAAIGSAYPLR